MPAPARAADPPGGAFSDPSDGVFSLSPIVAVAVSGGRDSLCLLHATLGAARALGLRVLALHVHHGLMPQADAWAARLSRRCRRWARAGEPLELQVLRLSGAPGPGASVEAWARRERYAALARAATQAGANLVLLGHHRRDQAETVLLQALRGAGPAGLAAMPAQATRAGLAWARPWLAHSHEAIDAYARLHGLSRSAVDDPSNADPRFDRSRLRHEVMPALREAFPQAEAALAGVARQAAQARAALDELAALDLATLEQADGLAHAPWQALSEARRLNALRAWLGPRLPEGAPDTLLHRLMGEWRGGSRGRWPAGEGVQLRAWRGRLAIVASTGRRHGPGRVSGLEGLRSEDGLVPDDEVIRIDRAGDFPLPGWGGRLVVTPTTSGGVAATPGGLALRVAPRRGGEQFARARRATPRSLKKQYQDADIPSWRREGPLLWVGDRLVFVPGLGIDARSLADDGAAQWALDWVPDERP